MKKATSILFILATLLFAPVYLAHAQKPTAIPRIGVLYLGAPHSNANFDVFIQGLKELGDIEGKNILIEYRYAEGKEDCFLSSQRNWSDLKSMRSLRRVHQPFSLLSEQPNNPYRILQHERSDRHRRCR